MEMPSAKPVSRYRCEAGPLPCRRDKAPWEMVDGGGDGPLAGFPFKPQHIKAFENVG